MERWKPVPGFDDYLVSDQGRVKSLKYNKEKLLSSFPQRKGYRYINLCKDGRLYKRSVARLVLEAFVGPGEGLEACHGPLGNQDNRLENLRWDTPESNTADKYKHGTMPFGSVVHNSKLTEEVVAGCRILNKHNKVPIVTLAKAHGVARQTMAAAIHGKTWTKV